MQQIVTNNGPCTATAERTLTSVPGPDRAIPDTLRIPVPWLGSVATTGLTTFRLRIMYSSSSPETGLPAYWAR
jgi:hypothetical protein